METRKVYVALTREPTILGFSFKFLVIVVWLSVMVFLTTKSLIAPLYILPLLGFDYYFQKKDQGLLSVLFNKAKNCPPVKNKNIWGNSNSYETRVDHKI